MVQNAVPHYGLVNLLASSFRNKKTFLGFTKGEATFGPILPPAFTRIGLGLGKKNSPDTPLSTCTYVESPSLTDKSSRDNVSLPNEIPALIRPVNQGDTFNKVLGSHNSTKLEFNNIMLDTDVGSTGSPLNFTYNCKVGSDLCHPMNSTRDDIHGKSISKGNVRPLPYPKDVSFGLAKFVLKKFLATTQIPPDKRAAGWLIIILRPLWFKTHVYPSKKPKNICKRTDASVLGDFKYCF